MNILNKIRGTVLNVWLTTLCNQSCEYCFGRPTVTNANSKAEFFSTNELYKFIDWLFKSPFANKVQLMGGEPTQHPNIVKLVQKFNDRNVQTELLLTNGLMKTDVLIELKKYIPHFLFSINPPETYSEQDWQLIKENLAVLSYQGAEKETTRAEVKKLNRLTLSVTFFKSDQPYDYAIDLARQFNIPSIRISAAHPAPDFQNNYVELDKYQQLKPVLYEFVKTCIKEKIKVSAECFFPPCIFTVGEWKYLNNFVQNLSSHCEIPFELLPGLKIGFGACNFEKFDYYQLFGEEDLISRLHDWFEQRKKLIQYCPSFCRGCDFFEKNICQGGCLREKKKLKSSN